jgi:alpha-L-fucosidase
MRFLKPIAALALPALCAIGASTGAGAPVAFRDRLLPAPLDGGFRMEDYWVWCGSVIQGEDGRYHMFASRWPKGLSFSPHWLTNSEVVRAVSDTAEGPFRFAEIVLPPRGEEFWDGKMTHNPAIRRVGDTYLLYYTGTTYHGDMPTPDDPTTETSELKLDAHQHERIGLATAKSVLGPWQRRDKPILDVRPGTWEGYLVSNAAPVVMPDGKIMLFYKGVERLRVNAIGVALAETYEGPYVRLSDKPFDLGLGAEDPFIWFEDGLFHGLFLDHDRKYSAKGLYYGTSRDALRWEAEPNPVAISRTILWSDGRYRTMDNTERPHVLVQDGRSTHLFMATGDKQDGVKSTWNMVIPLKPAAQVGDRLAWWREARFGLFIHWGLYSAPAGVWKGEPVSDARFPNPYCEHLMWLARIPITEYSRLAEAFNPTRFDALAIVRAAKKAGMRYVVVTAKHHDGFAMYRSRVSPYNVVDSTPFGRDPLRELADACRQEGLKLGVYYSLGRDWHEADAVNRDYGNLWDLLEREKGDFQKYLDEKVKPQLEELLTEYGPVGVVWFDSPEQTTLKQSIDLELLVRRLQPDTIVNNRVGNEVGDYVEAPDNVLLEGGTQRDWEMPGTMAESWGMSRLDTPEYWKSSRELIRKLVHIVSRGGNDLLNVGPDGDGALPPLALERLDAIAAWMQVNGEAIQGATRARLREPGWGRYTQRGDVVYAHVFEWPEGRALVVPLAASAVSRVDLLTSTGPKTLPFKPTFGRGIVIDLPAAAPDMAATVLRITTRPAEAAAGAAARP